MCCGANVNARWHELESPEVYASVNTQIVHTAYSHVTEDWTGVTKHRWHAIVLSAGGDTVTSTMHVHAWPAWPPVYLHMQLQGLTCKVVMWVVCRARAPDDSSFVRHVAPTFQWVSAASQATRPRKLWKPETRAAQRVAVCIRAWRAALQCETCDVQSQAC